MARRRMLNTSIIESPDFYALSTGAQSMYMHLCTTADDDGFSGRLRMIQRALNTRTDRIQELQNSGLIHRFSPDVCLINHWRCHNLIRESRAVPSIYTDFRAKVFMRSDGCYVVMPEGLSQEEAERIIVTEKLKPVSDILAHSNANYDGLDKNRKEKENNKIKKELELEPDQRIWPPAKDEVLSFFLENGLPDGDFFHDCMRNNNWAVPGGDWKVYAKKWAVDRIKAYRRGFRG